MARKCFTGSACAAFVIALFAIAAPNARAVEIVAPALGRPAFATPGDMFSIVLAEAPNQAVEAALIQPRGGHRYPLQVTASADADAGAMLVARVAPNIPEATYDLSLRIGSAVAVARHCVAVRKFGAALRIVQLSDLRLGGPCTQDLPAGLPAEINLLAPDIIVATGGYLDPAHHEPATGWSDVARYFAQFDAPLFAACGPADDLMLFTASFAPSATGELMCGNMLLLSVFDSPAAPLQDDDGQTGWLVRRLAALPPGGWAAIVSHTAPPPHFDSGRLRDVCENPSLTTWISSAHFLERASGPARRPAFRMFAAHPHADSAAAGVRYRILDLRSGKVAVGDQSPMLSPGSLELLTEIQGDTAPNIAASRIINRLPHRIQGIEVRLRVAKQGSARPWTRGGVLTRLSDCGDSWECVVRTSVPDRSAVVVQAGAGAPPEDPQLDIQWLSASPSVSAAGVHDPSVDGDREAANLLSLRAGDREAPASLSLRVTNGSQQTVTLAPIVRWKGQAIPYSIGDNDANAGGSLAVDLTLPPTESLELRLAVPAATFSPSTGSELQVYPFGGATLTPVCLPVDSLDATRRESPAVGRGPETDLGPVRSLARAQPAAGTRRGPA